jgi:UDP:flavonoid glycosyltransferase YjiC (YdhE family)
MKTILLAWELGGGLGHLMRLRPLAAALLAAGHRVVLLARHQSAKEVFSELADRHGSLRIGPAPVLKAKRVSKPDPATTPTLADVLAAQGFDDAKALFAAAERWHLVLDRLRPDLVISDFSPTLNLVARGRAPRVVVGTGFTVPPDVRPLPPALPWLDEAPPASTRNETRVFGAFARIATANGLPAIERLAQLFRGDATFVCTLAELDPYRRHRETAVHFPYNVGSVAGGPPWPERRERNVFLYLPGNHPHLATVLDALRAQGVHGSAYVPKLPASLVGAFGDLRLCERAPPLSEVLPKVRLVVHQGGLGTATAALMAGTPQLVLPRYLEQHVTGYCLFKLGAGVNFTATKPLDPAAFGNALARLLSDPAPARRTMSLAGRFAFSDSDRTLSLILERCFAMLG